MWARGPALVAVMLAWLLAGCDNSVITYPVTPDVAKKQLAGTFIPDNAFGMGVHCAPGVVAGNQVIWALMPGRAADIVFGQVTPHKAIMKMIATLTAVDGGTQVTVGLIPPDGGKPDFIEKFEKEKPELADLYHLLVKELVDAAINRHDLDMNKLSPFIASAMMPTMPAIRKEMDDMVKQK